jgi:predicted RNase H-like HicB family nuclease
MEYYLKLPWTFRFEYDSRGEGLYVASVAELKGCMSHGDTIEEAAKNIQEALECHLESMLLDNEEIPEPVKISDCSGKLMLRIPPEKHLKLVKKAATEGKSLNKLINEIIDKEVA